MAETTTETLKKTIWEELAKIYDPEIGLSITELGLIYDLKLDEANKADITMTFTSMACPYGPQLKAEAHAAASRVEGSVRGAVRVLIRRPSSWWGRWWRRRRGTRPRRA